MSKLVERRGSSSDLSITSVMDGSSPDGDGLRPPLQPPPGENAYRHSTFEALVNTRPRFGGGVNSPRDRGKGRIPLSMTPASSISDFSDGSGEVALGKRPVNATITPHSSVQNLRPALTSNPDGKLDKSIKKAKQVKFQVSTALPPVIDNKEDEEQYQASSSSPDSSLPAPGEPTPGTIPALPSLASPGVPMGALPWHQDYINAPEQGDDDGPPSSKSRLRDNSFSE